MVSKGRALPRAYFLKLPCAKHNPLALEFKPLFLTLGEKGRQSLTIFLSLIYIILKWNWGWFLSYFPGLSSGEGGGSYPFFVSDSGSFNLDS